MPNSKFPFIGAISRPRNAGANTSSSQQRQLVSTDAASSRAKLGAANSAVAHDRRRTLIFLSFFLACLLTWTSFIVSKRVFENAISPDQFNDGVRPSIVEVPSQHEYGINGNDRSNPIDTAKQQPIDHGDSAIAVAEDQKGGNEATAHRRLYVCGWPLPKTMEALFGVASNATVSEALSASSASASISSPSNPPATSSVKNFIYAGEYHRGAPSSARDVLLFGMHGSCNGTTKEDKIKPDYVESNFAGNALFVNGEPYGNLFPLSNYPCGPRFGCPRSTQHLYQIGSVMDSQDPHAMRVFYAAVVLLERFSIDQHRWIFEHDRKRHAQQPAAPLPQKDVVGRNLATTPHGVYNAVIYMSRRCVEHRQTAALKISAIVPLHFGSHCKPDVQKATVKAAKTAQPRRDRPRIMKAPDRSFTGINGRENYWDNYKLYSTYKYCLCMENTNRKGYISEKILLAFLGGCLPIYWGTQEVFEVFNRHSFIYYDVDDPMAALDQIRYLESNYTAYQEMMVSQPILKDGLKTIENFFSLTDSIGEGTLKRRVRDMLGV